MDRTKSDLCADTVTIDYQELIRTAMFAFVELRESLNRELHKMYVIKAGTNDLMFAAKNSSEIADKLAVVAEMYHVLAEGQGRKEVIITNKN